jgi:hypothetical protein
MNLQMAILWTNLAEIDPLGVNFKKAGLDRNGGVCSFKKVDFFLAVFLVL